MPEIIALVVGVFALVVLAVAGLYLWPASRRGMSIAPTQPLDFDTATRVAEAVVAAEAADPEVRPESRSRLLSHGSRTSRVVLLLHGYTLAPDQYDGLAEEFFDRGYNVWIPRAPQHGTVDRRAHHRVQTGELTAYAAQALAVAAGLGDEVGVVGISGGAVLAAWLAQARVDVVRRLLLLSPFFGPDPRQAPAFAVKPLIVLYGRRLLPDRVTSRGYSLSAVTQYLSIARSLPNPPRRTGLRSAAVAISPLDGVVDLSAAVSVPGRIADANAIPLRVHTLPEALGVGHNILNLTALGAEESDLRQQYIALYEGDATPTSRVAETASALALTRRAAASTDRSAVDVTPRPERRHLR
ncbi:pimeloyl-ACP methyl ester carboxylesterase [Micromonospora luteifusca]|uniref:Pimeloyl-ACP methyl ester carboxylesterase n=1 Tax=Micromonospora luteifusca TaxID=709860 RepID=A0ABS2LLX2_9ACTN|nr:alpha/beta fold hydrolase [Micromonospora luteifusca]MBM7489181.1 pimeloyl-ACP methyl ester carboxylesterase [Micromonospora luteifusca]